MISGRRPLPSLRTRVLLLTLLGFVLVSAPAYFAFTSIVETTVLKLGSLFAEKQVLYDRYRGLGALMQEVKLAETLAGSEAVREWAKDENNLERKARGLAELEHYRQTFADHSYFFVVDASGNYYFNDADNSFSGKQFSHTLSRSNPRDSWYYDTVALGEGCHLNVDHDDVLQVTKVWINCLVRDGDRVLGVIGSGLDLSAFIREVVDVPQVGVTAMFVDPSGAVQAHRDPRLMDFHSITKDIATKKTVYALLDRQQDRDALRRMIEGVTSSDVLVQSHFMTINGHDVLVGVGYLDRLGWYNVTIMDIDKVIDRSLFLPIGLLIIALMLLCALGMGYLFKRVVLDRLARVESRFAAVSRGQFSPDRVDTGDDEIGRLSQAFAGMATAVGNNTQMLERMVAERTEQLQRLAYSDQMTGIFNRRGFIDAYDRGRLLSAGESMGVMLIDIDNFKAINDSHGHEAGDRVVVEMARRLQTLIRSSDACGRWGGDEMILLLRGIPGGDLQHAADTIRDAVSRSPIVIGDDRAVPISVSIGATHAAATEELGSVTARADAALYRAKAEGRNRAVLADLPAGEGSKLRA